MTMTELWLQTTKTRGQRERFWAGGDVVTGSATLIRAMGAGKRAAADINRFLNKRKGRSLTNIFLFQLGGIGHLIKELRDFILFV